MLSLKDKIGAGIEREIYRHPKDPERIVKVRLSSARCDRNAIEFAYQQRHGLPASGHIARIYAFEETDRGPGLVCEFIREADGAPSPNLPQYVRESGAGRNAVLRQLHAFFDWAEREAVCLYDIHLDNFMVQRGADGAPRLVMIDGFGPRFFNWRWRVRMMSPALIRLRLVKSRRRVALKWRELEAGL